VVSGRARQRIGIIQLPLSTASTAAQASPAERQAIS
jgi:hypothetical protein